MTFTDRVWGPVITAVDVGHVNHHGRCVTCRVEFPCPVILAARKSQEGYGLRLARARAIDAGRLSMTGAQ